MKKIVFVFLCVLSFISSAKENLWREMATRDLTNLKAIIMENHPGVVDKANPAFNAWLNDGAKKVEADLKYVTSFPRYYYLLKKYIKGFADVHLSLTAFLEQRQLNWPGFIMAKRDGKYIVHFVSEDASFKDLPKKGAELIRCGEQPPEYFLKENVYPFFVKVVLPSSSIGFAPYLLLDFENPFALMPNKCTFQYQQKQTAYKLDWQPVLKKHIWSHVQRAGFGERPEFSIEPFGKNGHWLTIPTFKMNGQHVKPLKEVWAQLPSFRTSDVIVLDLRGNTGGSSEWGLQFMSQLFGPAYAGFIEYRLAKENQYIEYRASKQNYQYFKKTMKDITAQYGENSSIHRHFRKVLKGLRQALIDERDFYRTGVDLTKVYKSLQNTPMNPVKAKIIVLTDGRCASACLSFLDKLLLADNVMHVGHVTNADTPYMDVIRVTLPSGLFVLTYPTKVYRNRLRQTNVPYTPVYFWRGDMSDTESLQSWIKRLKIEWEDF